MPPLCETCSRPATTIWFWLAPDFDIERDDPLAVCTTIELSCDAHDMHTLWCEVWEWHTGPDSWRQQALDAGRPDLVAMVDRALCANVNGKALLP